MQLAESASSSVGHRDMLPVAPLISVIIPTRGRPHLVLRALRSVLGQTYDTFEVLVIIDGPDSATADHIASIPDSRIRVIRLPESVGGSEARNVGIRASAGEWVALLDDDDEWLPEKLQHQVAEAQRYAGPYVFVATRYISRGTKGDTVEPQCLPKPTQAISEYLFCTVPLLGYRKGFLQTSTWLVSTQLMLEVPFTKGLQRNQDTDWLLRASNKKDLTIAVLTDVLSIFYNDTDRVRISKTNDWRYSLEWAINNREIFTPKALSYFIATISTHNAAKLGEPSTVLWSLLANCRQYGRLTPGVLWFFARNAFLFPWARRFSQWSTELRSIAVGQRGAQL
ncbi:MAG: glycosyltransferase family 2 protein [Ktedonobacteraceae bacterium]